MIKKILLIITLFLGLNVFSQVAPDKYYIQFTDKNNSPYSIDNPSEFLTQRAIDRRIKYGIPVTKQDIPVNPSYIQGVSETGAIILNPTKWLNGVTIYTDNPVILEEIESLPYVADIKKVASAGIRDNHDKSFFKNEWYDQNNVLVNATNYSKSTMEYDYGYSLNQILMLNGISLHNQGYMGQGMVIAVLDAGFRGTDTHIAFDSLRANSQILGTRDFVDNSETVYDYHGHGTAVLSTMAGFVEGELIGTAPKADYWLLRSEEANQSGIENIIEEYNWVSAAEFADSVGADIINSSLGYSTFDDPSQDHTYEDMDGNTTPITIGADIAAGKGMLVVNSAGNSGGSSWYYITAPADGDSVYTIGAVMPDSIIAGFSSHGPTYDGRIKPDVVAQGAPAYVGIESGYFTFGSGTSFSSPIIAGMSACLWQAHPPCENMELIDALKLNASKYNNPDNSYGWGIPDFGNANLWLSMNENDSDFTSLKLFPNPLIDGTIYIVTGQEIASVIKINIFDRIGNLIKSYDQDNFSDNGNYIRIDGLDKFSPGVYIISLIGKEKEISTKFIK